MRRLVVRVEVAADVRHDGRDRRHEGLRDLLLLRWRTHAHREAYHTFFREGSEIKWLSARRRRPISAPQAKKNCPGGWSPKISHFL